MEFRIRPVLACSGDGLWHWDAIRQRQPKQSQKVCKYKQIIYRRIYVFAYNWSMLIKKRLQVWVLESSHAVFYGMAKKQDVAVGALLDGIAAKLAGFGDGGGGTYAAARDSANDLSVPVTITMPQTLKASIQERSEAAGMKVSRWCAGALRKAAGDRGALFPAELDALQSALGAMLATSRDLRAVMKDGKGAPSAQAENLSRLQKQVEASAAEISALIKTVTKTI